MNCDNLPFSISSARTFYQVLTIALLVSCTPRENQMNKPIDLDAVAVTTDEYFTALTDLKKFNGIVRIFNKDSVLLEKAYTIYPNPDSSTYVTPHQPFDIHSVSKLMARALIAKLEAEGRISKNQPIADFFPDFPKGETITLEMLLDNSSGLPRELSNLQKPESEMTPTDIVNAAKSENLLFSPGTDVQYSNVGYELVYEIIARTYEKPFAQSLVDELFSPRGMEHSGAWFYANVDAPVQPARNHVLRDSLLVQVPNISPDEFKTARVYSTADDLHRFLMEMLNEPYLTALTDENGIIAKDGGSRGIRAQVYMDTKTEMGYIMLANYDEMPFFDTVDDMAKILRSDSVEIPKPIHRTAINLPDSIMQRYEGNYVFADFDGMVIRVAAEGHTLTLYQGEKKIGSLRAESETVFFENPKSADTFEFAPADSGGYNALMGWKGIVVEGVRVE